MIKLPSELTITQVNSYCSEVIQLIDNEDVINLDDSELVRIDTIGVQFILALITYIHSENKELHWQSKASILHESIKQLGITDSLLMQYLPS